MIEELVKEKREERDQEETNKIMSAIHNQAKDRYYFEKGKRYLATKKNTKKEFKARLIEDTLNFGLFVIAAIPTILLLVVFCY